MGNVVSRNPPVPRTRYQTGRLIVYSCWQKRPGITGLVSQGIHSIMGNVVSRNLPVPRTRYQTGRLIAEILQVQPRPPDQKTVLLGKTAQDGVSCCREEFRSEASSSSITKMLEKGEQQIGGKLVSVIDTRSFSNTRLSKEEVKRCISLSEDQKSEMFVQKNEFLKQLVEKCRVRYHVFNNQNRSDRTQVSELLEKIKEQYSSYTKIKRGKGKAPKTKRNKIKYILVVAAPAALAWALYHVKDLFIAYKKVEKYIPISAIKQDPKGFKRTLQLTFKFGAINILSGFYLKIVSETSQLENAFKAPVEGFKHTFNILMVLNLSGFYLKIVSKPSEFYLKIVSKTSEFYLKIVFKTS